MTAGTADRSVSFPETIESRTSWTMAWLVLAILTITYGAPLIVVVGLQPIATALSTGRSDLALANGAAWLGMGLGGIPMGWLADRVGLRKIVLLGAASLAGGLLLSASGGVPSLLLGHGMLVGFFGTGAIYAPLLIYVSRLFDRHRGFAVALITSGQYLAGIVWPMIFEQGLAHFGWRATMTSFAGLGIVTIVPMALFLRPLPWFAAHAARAKDAAEQARALLMPANGVQALLCVAGFCCCVPMAMPSGHLVALCGDLGISPASGAAMLSVLLGCAFLSRQVWGWVADRIGGLRTVFAASFCQATTMVAFIVTRNELALFAVSALFGLGFSGIIPGYMVAIRHLFSFRDAAWRIPAFSLFATSGMAFGNWLAGALFDHFGSYAPAFSAAVLFNIANLILIRFLVNRARQEARLAAIAAAEV